MIDDAGVAGQGKETRICCNVLEAVALDTVTSLEYQHTRRWQQGAVMHNADVPLTTISRCPVLGDGHRRTTARLKCDLNETDTSQSCR